MAQQRIKIITVWLLLIVCMILHFDYHVSELFYGIDIRNKDADGTIPERILFIRSAFHFLPLLYIVMVLWLETKTVRIFQFILSLMYTLSHCFHLAGEISKGNNPSQIVLLSVTAFLSLLLILASWEWMKTQKNNTVTV